MVTDTPVWRGAKTGKDRRRAGNGGFPGFRRQLRATTTVRYVGRRTSRLSRVVCGPVPKVVGRGG